MSDLLNQAREIRNTEAVDEAKQKEAAAESMIAIAMRDIAGETLESDAQDLVSAMAALGVSEGYYSELVQAIPAAARAEGDFLYCQEKEALAPEKFKEYARTKAMREFSIAFAKQEYLACNVAYTSSSACGSITALAKRFPMLFQAEPGRSYPKARFMPELAEEQIERNREREKKEMIRAVEQSERASKPLLMQSGAYI